jgi:hypothetical protein
MIKATKYGRIDILDLCLEWGANDYEGVMICAALNCRVEIIKLCLLRGFYIYKGAIMAARVNGHKKVIRLFNRWNPIDFTFAIKSFYENI